MKVRKSFLSWMVLLLGGLNANAATINLNAGDILTLTPNSTTTVSCSANGGGGGNGSGASVSVACGGNAVITIDAVSLDTGTAQGVDVSTGDWSNCSKYASALQSRFGQSLLGPKIGAICGQNATLYKVLVNLSGAVKIISTVATGDWSKCAAQADSFNSAK